MSTGSPVPFHRQLVRARREPQMSQHPVPRLTREQGLTQIPYRLDVQPRQTFNTDGLMQMLAALHMHDAARYPRDSADDHSHDFNRNPRSDASFGFAVRHS